MLSTIEYQGLKQKLAIYNQWAEQYKQKNGWIVIPADVNRPVIITNDDRSAMEVYEFVNDPPGKYFAYIKAPEYLGREDTHYGGSGIMTTWTGEKLGNVQFGNTWEDNFGGKRVSIAVYAINGKKYYGTYYKSSGNYCRIKLVKGYKANAA